MRSPTDGFGLAVCPGWGQGNRLRTDLPLSWLMPSEDADSDTQMHLYTCLEACVGTGHRHYKHRHQERNPAGPGRHIHRHTRAANTREQSRGMGTVPLSRHFCPCSGGWQGAHVQNSAEAYRLFPSPGELQLLRGGGSAFRGSECISLGYQETRGRGKYAVSSVTSAPMQRTDRLLGPHHPSSVLQHRPGTTFMRPHGRPVAAHSVPSLSPCCI